MEEKLQIILTRGIPGSGKSYWAKNFVKDKSKTYIRVNNDDIRNMLGEYWIPSRESLVTETRKHLIKSAIISKYNIIVDNMNFGSKYLKEVLDIIEETGKTEIYEISYKDFFIPVEECIRRDSERSHPIGVKVIKDLYKQNREFIVKKIATKEYNNHLIQDKSLPHITIFDMDGTLSLNVTGRPFYGIDAEVGYLEDKPNKGIVDLAKKISNEKLVILTGRTETDLGYINTLKWLSDQGLYPFQLFMRATGDYNKAYLFKETVVKELMKSYYIDFIVDDEIKCVEMFRSLGLTCLQPNNGNI